MSKQQLAVGDVVQLKSGGPKMTVTAVGETSIVAVWFSQGSVAGFLQTHFPPATLNYISGGSDDQPPH